MLLTYEVVPLTPYTWLLEGHILIVNIFSMDIITLSVPIILLQLKCSAYFHWLSRAVKFPVDTTEGMLYSYAECTCL